MVTMDTETGRKATRDALEEAAREAGREPAVVQGNFDPRLLTDSSPVSTVNVGICYQGRAICLRAVTALLHLNRIVYRILPLEERKMVPSESNLI